MIPVTMPDADPLDPDMDAFIDRWEASGGHERANYQLFLTELCDLLDVPRPDPAKPENAENAYVFERSVTRANPDGTSSTRYLDLYRSGCFVLETKQGASAGPVAGFSEPGKGVGSPKHVPSGLTEVGYSVGISTGHGKRGTAGYDKAMEKAFNQAAGYIRDLPAGEGRPPFLIVCDVGHVFEIYAEFTRSGGRYQRFPDPKNHRIYLEDLRDAETRALLRTIWTDPLSLDPAKRVAKVTRDIAGRLALLAKSLEQDGHDPEVAALFLQRCLFTMFAEDIGLLPKNGFLELLRKIAETPAGFPVMITSLWNDMAKGAEFSAVLLQKVAHFNGGLFENPTALPLSGAQISLLIHAAESDWTEVDPAIFGTLLERALDPRERHKLGAHYTPRSYVERLIEPTVMEPLRAEWEAVKTAAVQLLDEGQEKKARTEVEAWHHRLCRIRVLDPACGSGNFLYVTLEHLKRLEAEVLDFFESIGGDRAFEMDSFRLRPTQFLGIEINPSAARIAQLVLWIGYFQWQYRTTGTADTNDRPLLKGDGTIENRDAVLDYDEKIPRRDGDGNVVTIWDGETTKPHPVTGKEVPDESARKVLFDYENPRRPEWPEADFVVGNPPFVGASRMRDFLGDGYTEAVRKAWKGDVPESADFVMFWWQRSAELLRAGKIRRFGLITTNSIHQTFNRRVLEPHLNDEKKPMHLAFAIPDHPWVDSGDGAAVRIAMTVGAGGNSDGVLQKVIEENEVEDGEHTVILDKFAGSISGSLRTGADLNSADALVSNRDLSSMGVKLHGKGFLLDESSSADLRENPDTPIRRFTGSRDLVQQSRNLHVVDAFGYSERDLRDRHPKVFQHLLNTIKPERDAKAHTKDGAGYAKTWWQFGKPRPALRHALTGLKRFIATPRTAKHRIFLTLDTEIVPESEVICIASDDFYVLGLLSSNPHTIWSLGQGGRMGVGNDPRYNKSRCFETFPFPDPDGATRDRIRELGEKLDAHRKRQQALHPDLTLTGIYNVLERLRELESAGRDERPARSSGDRSRAPGPDAATCLTPKEREIHDKGLVSVLQQIHDELDAAVFHAYGWDDLWQKLNVGPASRRSINAPGNDRRDAGLTLAAGASLREEVEAELLERLVALNHERAEEEKRGLVRWLRPEFQAPDASKVPVEVQSEIQLEAERAASRPALKVEAQKWPEALPDQVAAIQKILPALGPDPEALSATFGRKSAKRQSQIEGILATLEALGQL